MSLGECCIKGVHHEGTPKGKIEKIGGTPVYVTLPQGDYDKTKALLFLPDVFGVELKNARLLADDFAENGYATYLIDYLNNDALGPDDLNSGTFDLPGWLKNHGQDVTRPFLDNAMKGLREQGIKTFAATGHCFGGRYVVDLVVDDQLKVGIVGHPSLLEVPADLEAVKKHSVPFLWNTCENDFMFPKEAQETADKVFAGDKNYKRNYYPGCDHGFTVRGDMSDPKVKAGKEGAFEESVKFLQAHF